MKRQWATLACDWYLDSEIAGIAAEHDAVLKVWPILIGLSKSVSHHERNPQGWIEITRSDLMHFSKTTAEELQTVLDELHDGGLIKAEDEGRHGLVIGLTGFEKWQTPKGSAADRKRVQRAREAAESQVRHESVTGASQVRHEGSEQGKSQVRHAMSRETETETETEKTPPTDKATDGGGDGYTFGKADEAMQRLTDRHPEERLSLMRIAHSIKSEHGDLVLKHAADVTFGAAGVENPVGYLRSVAAKAAAQVADRARRSAASNREPCATCDDLGMIEADGGAFVECSACKQGAVA